MKAVFSKILFVVLIGLFGACGTDNILKDSEEADAAEDATIELENDNAEKAIEILEEALQTTPNDYQLISILSAAYAQKGGVSFVDLALNFADSASDDEGTSTTTDNPLTSLWAVLPDATESNLSDVNESVVQLRSIPADSRTDADNFKLGILSTALASLQLKALDTNNDGQLSVQELAAISLTDADVIIAALASAAGALAGLSSDAIGEESTTVTTEINTVVTAVNGTSGADSSEQLQNYFANN